VYNLSGGNWTKKNIPTGSDPHGIAFSKDGTKAYVTNQGSGSLSVINTSTYSKIQDIVVGSKPNGIALKD
jgi:YVTN family beta-propeller protein